MAKKIFISIIIMFFCTSFAIAGDQTKRKDQKKDQKKDGSCETIQMDSMQKQIMAKDQIQKRHRIKITDRKRYGSNEAIGLHSSQYRMNVKQNMNRKGN